MTTEDTTRPARQRPKKAHVARGARVVAVGLASATALGLVGILAEPQRATTGSSNDPAAQPVPTVTGPILRIVVHHPVPDDGDDGNGPSYARPMVRRVDAPSTIPRASTHGSD